MVFICGTMFSQSSESPVTSSELKLVTKTPVEGTYQIIARNQYSIVNISKEILNQIENKREVENETYIIVDKNVRIKILSANTIKSNGFIPLEKIRYEN